MTIYYFKEVDGENTKYKANINLVKLKQLYNEFFNQQCEKKEIKFKSPKKITIHSTDDVIIENFNVEKVGANYEITYTIYNYPKICQIINGLINAATFCSSYENLLNLLVSTKQQKIEEVRKKIDREIRVFNVLLDSEKRDSEIFQKINAYSSQIKRICDYDKELANQAKLVAETITIQKIDEKVMPSFRVNSMIKNKKLIKK